MQETLSSPKQNHELLEQYLQRRSEAAPTERLISRRAPGAAIPLTFAQEQVWLHAQLAPNSALYNEPFTVHRKGPLDVSALERSITEIVRRHEAWRTTFAIVDGQPLQLVHPPFEIHLPLVDLRSLPESEREAAALRLAEEDARRPFNLAKLPLLRARLVCVAENDFRLFMCCHHLIFDGVTGYQVFLPELISLYHAFCNGQPSPLPELPFQYADYAVWQSELNRDLKKGSAEYWCRQLGGTVPVLQLPTDRPRPTADTFRGAMQPFSLSSSVSEGLRSLSRAHGVTLFMTLLAAFDTLLYRYSGQEDILVGSITAGRNRPGTEKLLGFFLNTVVLRTNLSGDPTFVELLERVRRVTIEALSHDDVPLNQIVKELNPDRDFSRNPLFRVLLSLEPSASERDAGWDLTPIDVETGASKFDLCLVLDDRREGLTGRVIYSTDLFDAATIERLVECWQTLLQSVVADPSVRVSDVAILPERERHRQLVDFNETQKAYPLTLVLERFEREAERTPAATAVKCGDHALSYQELDLRATTLASYLRGIGVGPEVVVALCLERSVEMVIGILGVLKAGGAYVPMDPAYPRDRLDFMLNDCGAAVLLTQSHLPSITSFSGKARVICLDREWDAIAGAPENAAAVSTSPDDLAYVIYTSGSTGGPKGVEVTHRNLAQSTSARLDYYDRAKKKFLLLSSFAFDSSVAVIFHALCSGATLVLPGPEVNWGSGQISSLIFQNQVSDILCIPSVYNELLQAGEVNRLASLRRVILAGESCARQVAELHYRLLPDTHLFNEYGPTEATVWSTVHRCEPQEPQSSIPIGRPISNTQLYVLDRNLQLLPLGVPGELCIAGDGVARGYLNRPELTREKFVRVPFGGDSGLRMYKTGDLVCYSPDGVLRFLGRLDEQVKIRGMRIELSEIEATLCEHPDVKEAAVSVEAGKKLVAHIVSTEQYATSTDELSAFLKSRLPGYMIPTAYKFVQALPRTPNGKVDRVGLQSISEVPAEDALAGPVSPRDSTEARLLTIWKQVLGIESSDVTQNFFQLGGHSLLAAKLLYRIETEFGQPLSLAFVFQAPTIELMADWLRHPDQSLRARTIVEIQPKGSQRPLFWVRGGPRFRLLAQKLGMDQPFLGLDIPFSDAIKLPAPYRIEDVAAFLIRALQEVQPHGPYSIAGLCVNAVIAYEMARQLTMQGEEVGLLAMLDGHNQAYYKNPLRDGRYTGRIKYHLSNIVRSDIRGGSAYILKRLEEARRKLERTIWQLSSEQANSTRAGKMHNADAVIHPAFHRYEPETYRGKVVLLQSSEWPEGDYFNFALGWRDLVQGGIEFHRIRGDHPSMFTEPNAELVAAKLRLYLSPITAGNSASGR